MSIGLGSTSVSLFPSALACRCLGDELACCGAHSAIVSTADRRRKCLLGTKPNVRAFCRKAVSEFISFAYSSINTNTSPKQPNKSYKSAMTQSSWCLVLAELFLVGVSSPSGLVLYCVCVSTNGPSPPAHRWRTS